MTKYHPWLFIVLAAVLYPTTKSAIATGAKSQPMTAMADADHDKEIPIGFKLERYAPVWERNPFVLVTVDAPQAQHSPFEKLFLKSWLKDGRTDVIFIQNLETNEVQKITAEPNENNLRLVALRPNPDPRLAEAMISNGKEEGPVKFRLDVTLPAGIIAAPAAQTANAGASGPVQNTAQVAPHSMPGLLTNPPKAVGTPATPNAQADRSTTPSISPGVPGGHVRRSAGQAALLQQGIEGVRVPPRGQ